MPPHRKKTASEIEHTFNLVENGQLDVIRQRANIDFMNDRDYQGYTYLHRCVKTQTCDLPTLDYLLSQAPQLTDVTANDGKTPLCLACHNLLHPVIIQSLVTANPGVIDLPDNEGYTPLHYLFKINYSGPNVSNIITKHLEPSVLQNIRYLINNGANVNTEAMGISILQTVMPQSYSPKHHKRTMLRMKPLLDILLKNGVKVNSSLNEFWCFVVKLCEAQILLPLFLPILNNVNDDGKTLLHCVLMTLSCHSKNEIVKYLVQHGAEVAPGIDMIAVARSRNCDFNIIELLLEKYDNYDVNTRDSYGQTLLVQYGSNTDALNKLLSLGADPNLASNTGCTALGQVKDPASVIKLIEVGADPLQYNKPEESILATILESMTSKFEEWFHVLEYILNLPQIKNSEKKEELYVYTLNILFSIEFNQNITPTNLQRILMLLYDINESIVDMRFHHDIPKHSELTISSTHTFNLLGHAMATFTDLEVCYGFFSFFALFLNTMLDFISSIPNKNIEDEDCISPLTLFVFVTSADDEVNEFAYYYEDFVSDRDGKNKLLKRLIEKGCNVNSMSLQTDDSNWNEIKQNLQVPDVLLVSLLYDNKDFVEFFIPYWWGPPLALLCFCKSKMDLEFWFPILIKYDIVPRGMPIFQTLLEHLKHFEGSLDAVCGQLHRKLIEHPLSLQSMCKYAVRKCVAERVAPGDILSHVLRDNLPPLLKPVVLHSKLEEIGVINNTIDNGMEGINSD